MTVENTSNKIQSTVDGVQTDYPYDFLVLEEADMEVYFDDTAQASGYTITGLGDPLGGLIQFAVAPVVSISILTIVREISIEQKTDYSVYGAFPPERVEADYDKGILIDQQLDEKLGRALLAPISNVGDFDYALPTPIAGHAYVVNGANNALELTDYPLDDAVVRSETAEANSLASSVNSANCAYEASDSEIAAEASAAAALVSENNASNSADAAAISATEAQASADSIVGDKDAAAASAAAALVSENNASDSEDAAAISAAAALVSENNAAASEAGVAADALIASDAAAAALVSENNASSSASAASSSASAASSSASSASSSASASSTSAAESAASAAEAAGYIGAESQIATIDKIVASVNIVDAFIYDTSLDTDGGAWRERCSHLSWYNEELNTTTRGATRKFPAVALIVAEANKVTIYDATDDAVPMWMVFNRPSAANQGFLYSTSLVVSSTTMSGSTLVIGSGSSGHGVVVIDFLKDSATMRHAASAYHFDGPISDRNICDKTSVTNIGYIVNAFVNDVAMTVLADAPVDPATGLQIPTIAVATEGGVSVITDGGDVWDLTYTISTPEAGAVEFFNNGIRWSSRDAGGYAYVFVENNLPTADKATAPDHSYSYADAASELRLQTDDRITSLSGTDIGGIKGLTLLKENPDTPAEGMVNYITKDYQSGWMHGDIKGAWLADTDDTDLVGGTDADRSVNANPLTVNGTVARNPVATGSELVAYSGFSASDYLEQPYNADLDFGTGDFHMFANVVPINNGTIIMRRDLGGTGFDFFSLVISSSKFRAVVGGINLSSDIITDFSARVALAYVRRSGVGYLYINGVLAATGPQSADIDSINLDAVLRVGLDSDDLSGLLGSVNSVKIGAGAPSAEQIEYIYNQEKGLFQEGAACTLAGTSDVVLALDYDEDTDITHALTSYGRSSFSKGVRVASEATVVGTPTSISAGSSDILIGGTTAVKYYSPVESLRAELKRVDEQAAYYGQIPVAHRFVGDSSETDFVLPFGWAPTEGIYNAGLLVLNGASDEYTLLNDGFLKGVSFNVAPGVVDVVIFATYGGK